MAVQTEIPVVVHPDAAARVAELGLQREMDEMIAQAKKLIPGVRSFEVELFTPYDTGEDTRVTIEATIDPPANPSDDRRDRDWVEWFLETPPRVREFLHLTTIYGRQHGR
jgi:hypothetical protein